jgi:phosphoglycerol transferase MdoB-like AlkP superfamily enzyme
VLASYSLTPTWQMLVGFAVVIFYMVAIVMEWRSNPHKQSIGKKIALRAAGIAAACLMLFFSVHNPIYNSLISFQWDAMLLNNFHKDGMIVTFLKSLESARVEKPEGYSREIVEGYLKEYQSQNIPENNEAVRPTNIIMVMNEAFSDLRIAGLNESVDVMPFIDSLRENTIQGYLGVSVYGGGTCNTEFEALTGNSMAFMGTGSYPYTENVTKPLFSLASFMNGMGYDTYAFHANEESNWNRNKVYPNLGFGRFYSISDFEAFGPVEKLHNYPADRTDYAFMESVDAEEADHPRFLFDVTMQNHAYYDHWEDVEEAENVKELELGFDGKVYLSLVKASDEAVKGLVETYQNSDEPTMIVFFGDHQPSLVRSTQQQIYTKNDFMQKYWSKYFIWTNYEMESDTNLMFSANYMPLIITERCGIKLPPYLMMMKELYEKYPVITAQGVIDRDGNVYDSVVQLMDDPLIKKYQYIQFANMFDQIDDAWFVAE